MVVSEEFRRIAIWAGAAFVGIALLSVFLAALQNKEKTKQGMRKLFWRLGLLVFAAAVWISLLYLPAENPDPGTFSLDDIAAYTDSATVIVNENQPFFTAAEKKAEPYVSYSELDTLGRCGAAMAMLEKSMMPEEERGEIDSVKPSGYHNAYYPELIEDGFLYNRCHLIGFQFTGENANERNLITGTRYMNVEGMEPLENETAYYIRRTGNHVLYRVTPVFKGKELVCRGVLMEAYSIEDNGQGICYCVFCHNVQPGIELSYKDGTSRPAD